MSDTKKTINDLSTTQTELGSVNIMVQPKSGTNTLEKMDGALVAPKSDITALIDGTTVAKKAEKDASGNTITTTYATKTELEAEETARQNADTNLQQQINQHDSRLQNLEQKAGDYSIVQYSGTDAVPTGKAKYGLVKSIVGKTRAWNQLFKATNIVGFCSKVTDYQISISFDSSFSGYPIPMYTVPTINGHKYLLYIKADSGTNVRTAVNGIIPYYSETDLVNGVVRILTGDGNNCAVQLAQMTAGQAGSGNLYFIFRDVTNILSDWADADITTANIPLMVKQIPDLLKYDPYGYSIVDTVVSGVKSVGVNIWDEEFESGYIDDSGNDASNANFIRTKNYIPILPNTTYYQYAGSGYNPFRKFFYDANKNFISKDASGANGTFTTPVTAMYMRLYFADYGTTYKNDIQISEVHGSVSTVNTTYHPYKSDTLPLSTPVSLKSAGSVAEVLTLETGKKTRPIGRVDFGSLDWTCDGTYLETYVTGKKIGVNALLCPRYVTSYAQYATQMVDGQIRGHANSTLVGVKDSSKIDPNKTNAENASAFKTAMSGVMLYYELATPDTDEQVCDPIIDNFIEVEGGGTVETIQTQTPVIDNCLDVGYLAV